VAPGHRTFGSVPGHSAPCIPSFGWGNSRRITSWVLVLGQLDDHTEGSWLKKPNWNGGVGVREFFELDGTNSRECPVNVGHNPIFSAFQDCSFSMTYFLDLTIEYPAQGDK